jgi:6-phosphogluconolactonase|tara:strand:- start:700 stop:1359 length:660 start_codon:yes stop_codon:yes gene_type:complete
MQFRFFQSSEEIGSQMSDVLRNHLSKAGTLMLSGGSTPYQIYNQLAQQAFDIHPDCRLFLSDERCVPADSDKNNAYNLKPMLHALNGTAQFIAVDTACTPAEASLKFSRELDKLSQPDLGLLGIGADGHTAGIFNQSDAKARSAETTLYTKRPDGMDGVSVSASFIHCCHRIILLATGESKRDILTTLKKNPKSLIAGNVLFNHPQVEIWTDLDLSSSL